MGGINYRTLKFWRFLGRKECLVAAMPNSVVEVFVLALFCCMSKLIVNGALGLRKGPTLCLP